MLELTLKKWQVYMRLMRVDRPIGTYLVAWPALWALWIAADGVPAWHLILVFLLGAFLMRSAGCVINDFADRHVDGHVERTKNRPLVNKEIGSREALQLFCVLALLAAGLLFFTNRLTFFLAFVAIFLAMLYPFTKRFTHLPQIVLGMAFSWAVPMAFAAQTNIVSPIAWQLYFAVVLWVVAYDTFYAMVDRDDDILIGVKSTAILFGRYDKSIIAMLQVAFIAQMVAIGLAENYGKAYYVGVFFAGGLCVYQQFIVIDRKKDACFRAFLNNNYVGLSIFLGIVLEFMLR